MRADGSRADRMPQHFFGTGDYPLKGMHFLLEAMGRLKENYPDLKLYVAGNSIISHETAKDRCRLSAYGKYLLVLIRLYELQDRVIVLGRLSAEEMKAQFLRSSVFVCPSVMENSPIPLGKPCFWVCRWWRRGQEEYQAW